MKFLLLSGQLVRLFSALKPSRNNWQFYRWSRKNEEVRPYQASRLLLCKNFPNWPRSGPQMVRSPSLQSELRTRHVTAIIRWLATEIPFLCTMISKPWPSIQVTILRRNCRYVLNEELRCREVLPGPCHHLIRWAMFLSRSYNSL
jgi:hypothetical protein